MDNDVLAYRVLLEKRKENAPFECFETVNKIKESAPNGIAKGIDALLMSVVDGYSCKEIGEKLHMRTNIVTAQMSKARKYLRKIPELSELYFAGGAV